MNIKYIFLSFAAILLCSASCRRNNNNQVNNQIASEFLSDLPDHVIFPNLNDLSQQSYTFSQDITIFCFQPDDAMLDKCRADWYACRNTWEQSEAFLFGPVVDNELDPKIDDWPVNYIELDSILSKNHVFTSGYIDSLNTTLKGFHSIEYLIFGKNGTKKTVDFTAREMDFLKALGENLMKITSEMSDAWNPSRGNYTSQLKQAGEAGKRYHSKQEAMLEVAKAMGGIADEVGSEKIGIPFIAKDSMLEESPYSKNSWTDFEKNIQGIKNVYYGNYTTQGKSMQDFLNTYNKSLGLKIEQKIDAAIANLHNHQTPFGRAIFAEPAAVQATMNILADLESLLNNDLTACIKQNVKN